MKNHNDPDKLRRFFWQKRKDAAFAGILTAQVKKNRIHPGFVLILMSVFVLFAGCAQIGGYYHSVKNGFGKKEVHENGVVSLDEAKQYEMSGNPADAERLYLDYVNQASPSGNAESLAVAYSRLGVITARRGDYPASTDYFEKALTLNPNDVEISGAFAQSLFEQKKYVMAENLLRHGLLLEPEDKRIQYLLGYTLAEQKKYSLAARYLKQALGDEKAYQEMAMIYEKHGQKNAAILAVSKARQSGLNDQQPGFASTVPASHVHETLQRFQQEQLAQKNLGYNDAGNVVGNVYVSQPGWQTARIDNNLSGSPDLMNGPMNGGANGGYQGNANDGFASTRGMSQNFMQQPQQFDAQRHNAQNGVVERITVQDPGYVVQSQAITSPNPMQAGTQNSVQYMTLANPSSQAQGALPSPPQVFYDRQQNGVFPAQQGDMSPGMPQQPIPRQPVPQFPPPQGFAQTTQPYDQGWNQSQYGTSELAMRTDRGVPRQTSPPETNNPLARRNSVTVPPISVQTGEVFTPYSQSMGHSAGNGVNSFYDSAPNNQWSWTLDTNVIKPGERPAFLIND